MPNRLVRNCVERRMISFDPPGAQPIRTALLRSLSWAYSQAAPRCVHHVGVGALCRIKLFPVTHVLVDKWMLTVKLVYELSHVPDDLKWATNIHMTPFTLTFKA